MWPSWLDCLLAVCAASVLVFIIDCNIWYWRLPREERRRHDLDIDRYW